MLGDGSIVIIENIYRKLSLLENKNHSPMEIIKSATAEVYKPIIFSITIIIIVFLPIFTFKGIEGKMFNPMAFSISFALLGSLVFAVFIAPVLSLIFMKKGVLKKNNFVDKIKNIYKPLLLKAINNKKRIIIAITILFLISLTLIPFLGTEFIPTLEEGSISLNVIMVPSISLKKATETIMNLEKVIVKYDEVVRTVSSIGAPEAGSHPHPINTAHIFIDLKPFHEWTNHKNKDDLIRSLNGALSSYPGVQLNFSQPIQTLFDELLTGIKAQFAIKLYGEDLTVLRTKAEEIRSVIEPVQGLVDLSIEKSYGQPQVQVVADRYACTRYGVNVAEVIEMVEHAVGGEVIDQIYLGMRKFDIHIRLQEEYRKDPDVIKDLMIPSADGKLIPLRQVAVVKKTMGPIQINRENNQRRWVIQGNVRGRDIGSVVADAKKRIDFLVDLPDGYIIEFGGQFENQVRAMNRLAVIVPLSLCLIILLLYLTFKSVKNTLLIVINIPLALIGGIIGLFVSGEYLSVPASVGFIALFGIAVQNGVVLISYMNQLYMEGHKIKDAIIKGCMLRIRPVLMTAFTTILGLFPLLLSTGIGSEVQRPLAIVVVSGLFTSTILTLFVLPSLYEWFSDPVAEDIIVEKKNLDKTKKIIRKRGKKR
jgi:cobalt-zinc-cadmium resistance protein CzcA